MPTILLAENDEKEAEYYTSCLKEAGFNIIHTKNAEGIERIIAEQKIDILLSDTNLENSYGDEVCKKLLEKEKLDNLLIIGMSNALDYGDCWINIAHEFIHKRSLNVFFDLEHLVSNLYNKFQQNPKMLRHKENLLITNFGKSI
ncbi:MAG: response regulator [Nanoarchaeota archaeon]